MLLIKNWSVQHKRLILGDVSLTANGLSTDLSTEIGDYERMTSQIGQVHRWTQQHSPNQVALRMTAGFLEDVF
jgi:hypothetical protein